MAACGGAAQDVSVFGEPANHYIIVSGRKSLGVPLTCIIHIVCKE